MLTLVSLQSASAGAASPYARAKAKGKVFVHRPYYKAYKGNSRHTYHWYNGLFKKTKKKSSVPAGASRSRSIHSTF
ncbi:hypothetical protein LJY25_04090 [Hymenobacter sp. BT175]|nr:hypothetical protein [Hymenobacter translucens]